MQAGGHEPGLHRIPYVEQPPANPQLKVRRAYQALVISAAGSIPTRGRSTRPTPGVYNRSKVIETAVADARTQAEVQTMPRTNKPAKTKAPAAEVNGPTAGEVLTLAEAAAYLRLSEAEVLQLVEQQGLPARRLAQVWRFLKTAIQDWLRTGPAQAINKADQLAIIGAWKDDPNLEDMVEEIYRKRGRPITEDGSYRLFHGLNWEPERK